MPALLFSKLIKRLLIVVILFGVLSVYAFAEDTVRIGGAGSGLGLMRALAAEFEKTNPGIKINVVSSLGSSGGIKALSQSALDIAISGRGLTTEESKTGVIPEEFGRSPFIFVVHNNVNKPDLTSRELVMIYKEELKSWPNGNRIRLIHRPNQDTDTALLANISNEMNQAVNHANTISEKILAVTDQEAIELVEKIPGSFCASTLTQIITEKSVIKVLSYNGVRPSVEALKKGLYPLAKPLYLVTTKNISKPAMQFIKFLRSAKAQALTAKMGTLPTSRFKRE